MQELKAPVSLNKKEEKQKESLKVLAGKHFSYRQTLAFLHLGIDYSHEFRLEEITLHNPVHHPHYLSHVDVALILRAGVMVFQGEDAEQIEAQSVRDDVFALHRGTLGLVVITFIQRIVAAEILVERDSNSIVSHHDALVECTRSEERR